MNYQNIEKKILLEKMYDVHSIFNSIQGEGPFSGLPCTFIRMAGCNLQCPNCDTDYTSGRKYYTLEKFPELTNELVVITGGEPFRQNISSLLSLLFLRGHTLQIETNGTMPVNYIDKVGDIFIVCSPKTPNLHTSILQRCFAYKYVLSAKHIDENDGLPTCVLGNKVKRIARPPSYFSKANIYIQPEDTGDITKNRENLEACVLSSLKFGYRTSVQLHKIAGVQ